MWGCHPSHLHMVLYSIPLLFTLPDALWRKVTPLSPLGFFFTTQQVQHPVCLSTSPGNTQRLQKGPGSIRFTVLWRFVSCYYCVYEAKLDPLWICIFDLDLYRFLYLLGYCSLSRPQIKATGVENKQI